MNILETISRAMCKADSVDPDSYVDLVYHDPGSALVMSRRTMRRWRVYRDKAWFVVEALEAAETTPERETSHVDPR